jgi:hypothetical protein
MGLEFLVFPFDIKINNSMKYIATFEQFINEKYLNETEDNKEDLKLVNVFVNESQNINEAARVGRASWKKILKDLEREGWEIEGSYAIQWFGDEEQLRITSDGGDEVEYEVLNHRGKVTDSGSFDAEGLSAGELDSEVWNHTGDGGW